MIQPVLVKGFGVLWNHQKNRIIMKNLLTKKNIILTLTMVGLVSVSFVAGILLSIALLELVTPIIKLFLLFLFKVQICKGYQCGTICCGDMLVYILYSLILSPFLIWTWSKKKLRFFISILFVESGLLLGTFFYLSSISGV